MLLHEYFYSKHFDLSIYALAGLWKSTLVVTRD